MASGALAGGLATILLGSKMGRELGGDAVKLGGMAVIGGLAYKAYSDWQAKQAGQSARSRRRRSFRRRHRTRRSCRRAAKRTIARACS